MDGILPPDIDRNGMDDLHHDVEGKLIEQEGVGQDRIGNAVLLQGQPAPPSVPVGRVGGDGDHGLWNVREYPGRFPAEPLQQMTLDTHNPKGTAFSVNGKMPVWNRFWGRSSRNREFL